MLEREEMFLLNDILHKELVDTDKFETLVKKFEIIIEQIKVQDEFNSKMVDLKDKLDLLNK